MNKEINLCKNSSSKNILKSININQISSIDEKLLKEQKLSNRVMDNDLINFKIKLTKFLVACFCSIGF
jgi:hypothetical protein